MDAATMYVKPAIKKSLFFFKRALVQLNYKKEKYFCPICGYFGPFLDVNKPTGLRKDAQCPNCESFERHRLMKLVFDKLSKLTDFNKLSMLHFSPDPFFGKLFAESFKEYVSAHPFREDVEMNADIRNLPFENNRFDVVVASHVLERIKEDTTALSEIKRVLKPDGFAVLPVSIVSYKTIEYPQAFEQGNMRAPGLDYIDRYRNYFKRIEVYTSQDFPEKYQTYIRENRDMWPTNYNPMRLPMKGNKHPDIIPICFV